jgi:hypothetical protein
MGVLKCFRGIPSWPISGVHPAGPVPGVVRRRCWRTNLAGKKKSYVIYCYFLLFIVIFGLFAGYFPCYFPCYSAPDVKEHPGGWTPTPVC